MKIDLTTKRVNDEPISRVYHMDCMEFMKQCPDKFFEFALVDIPYGIGVGKMAYLKERKTTVKQKNGTRLNGNRAKEIYAQKDWDKEPPSQEYFNELVRVSKEQIIFGIEYVDWDGVGNGRIKWNKGVAEGVSFKPYEMAYCSLIEDEIELPLLWAGMCQAKSLNEPMVQQGNKRLNEKRIHPCHKPVLLYLKLLLDYAKPGDKILDTHLGSQSSRIAAYKKGFDFWGTELDADYIRDGNERFAKSIAMPLFDTPKQEVKQLQLL